MKQHLLVILAALLTVWAAMWIGANYSPHEWKPDPQHTTTWPGKYDK